MSAESSVGPTGSVEDRMAALVSVAHESLLDAPTATLLIQGLGRGDYDAGGVTLSQRAGHPLLLYPAAGALAQAVGGGCAAVLAVPITPQTPLAGTVVFSGRLEPTEILGSGTERTLAAELAPDSIVVEFLARHAGREHIDLTLYAKLAHGSCCGDSTRAPLAIEDFEQAAERIRVHINAQHSDRLVGAVAELTATDSTNVAGAALSTLNHNGVTLEWTDTFGGHQLPLSFTQPAEDPTQLARTIQAMLESKR